MRALMMRGLNCVRTVAAAVALLLLPVSLPAAELGRLFLAPAERAALDRARHRATVAPPVQPEPEVLTPLEEIAETLPPVVDPVRVDGYVSRSGGPATVWVNGEHSAQGAAAAQLMADGERVQVPLAGQPGGVALKPGQSFDPALDQVRDVYEQAPDGMVAPQ